MNAWRESPLRALLGVAHPILQAPMAGAQGHELAVAVAAAGGLGAIPCALLKPEQVREEVAQFRRLAPGKPLNLNFFCHAMPSPDEAREQAWRRRLRPYYPELGVDPEGPIPVSNRNPFDAAACGLVEELRPEVVSFHFGLPEPVLLARVKATGAKVLASATTPAEARWLAARGVDAVIAQGSEAGGHRGVFLRDEVYSQIGTFALVPQVVDAAGGVPVVATGGVADERGIRAALALGAAGVQIGTAYLLSPQAKVSALHRAALQDRERAEVTALTNIFSGRPARSIVNRLVRELGPLSDAAPAFPLAGGALMPLRAASEAQGSIDFMQLWSGQAAMLARAADADEQTRAWAAALDKES